MSTSASIGSFCLGTALAWSAPALPALDEEACFDECDIPGISEFDASVINSLLPLAGIFAGPVTGFLLLKIGRKWTIVIMAIPLIIGNTFFAISYKFQSEELIYAGRFLTGKKIRK